jgi:hypothetical protein
VPRARFRIVKGLPNTFRSTSKATRSFCASCGTQITFENDEFADEIDVTTCSLDHPEGLPPADHIWTSSRISWVLLADGLPEFPGARPPE